MKNENKTEGKPATTLEMLEAKKAQAAQELKDYKSQHSFKGSWVKMRKATSTIFWGGGSESERKEKILTHVENWLSKQRSI